MYSAAAIPSTLTLLAQLRERMIDAIEGVSPIDAQGFRLLRDRVKTDSETMDIFIGKTNHPPALCFKKLLPACIVFVLRCEMQNPPRP